MKKYTYDGIEVTELEFNEKHENFKKLLPNHPLSNLSDYKLNDGILIESGSLYGDTIYRALESGFKKIISVEIDEPLYNGVCERFSDEIRDGKVVIHLGSIIDVLPKILEDIDEPVTFWLDAHLHGGSFGVDHDCPIVSELRIINDHKIKDHLIMVDDMRIIRGNGWGSGNRESSVIESVTNINSGYKVTYASGLVADDVLIARI